MRACAHIGQAQRLTQSIHSIKCGHSLESGVATHLRSDRGAGYRTGLNSMQHPDAAPHKILKSHEIQLRVRYDEADPMGLLYHPRYFTYFEIARTEMLRASGGNYRQMEADGLFAVVVKAECKYHKPVRYDDLLTIRATLRSITAAKIEHEYAVLRGSDRLATGHVTLALVDRSGQIQKVPDWLRALS